MNKPSTTKFVDLIRPDYKGLRLEVAREYLDVMIHLHSVILRRYKDGGSASTMWGVWVVGEVEVGDGHIPNSRRTDSVYTIQRLILS